MSYESPPTRQSNNPMSTVSMISGIIGWVFFFLLLCVNFALVPLLAVATLGLGALLYICLIPLGCLSPIAWLAAVITGHIANNQIRDAGIGNTGMAKAGLIMGYIGLGLVVIGICASIVLSATGASVPFIEEILRPTGV